MAHGDLDGHDIKIEIYTEFGDENSIGYIMDHCGNVLESRGKCAEDQIGERIVKFDVEDYLTRHETILGSTPVDPEHHDGLIDIFSIGYWQENGEYEEPVFTDEEDEMELKSVERQSLSAGQVFYFSKNRVPCVALSSEQVTRVMKKGQSTLGLWHVVISSGQMSWARPTSTVLIEE